MAYTLINAQSINFTTTENDKITTLNKNFVINPEATYEQLKTAINSFNDLITYPINDINVINKINVNKDLTSADYEIIYTPPIIQVADTTTEIYLELTNKNYIVIKATIVSKFANNYVIQTEGKLGDRNKVTIRKIKDTDFRGETDIVDYKIYYPEGTKRVMLNATLT